MNAQSISHTRFKSMHWLVAACLATALAACGNGIQASQSSGQTDSAASATSPPVNAVLDNVAGSTRKPCQYMTRADAEAAVGQQLPNTTEQIPLGMCDYMSPEFYGASLTVSDWESIKNAATSGTHQPVAISGVGDEALNLNGSNGSNLYVRKGDRGFLLTLNGPQIDHLPDHGLEREKTLALKILPKL